MTAKSNAREGDGVAGLIAKWREGADALDAMMFDSARAARIECYRSCADHLEAAMQAQQGAEPVAWQPIESAPKDGTPIIGCAMQAPKFVPEQVGAYWATDPKQKRWTDGEWSVFLTHWMPMPAKRTGAPR